jgi:hypothetical protein
MQLATKAAGGDQAAIGKFLDWMDEVETRAAANKDLRGLLQVAFKSRTHRNILSAFGPKRTTVNFDPRRFVRL